MRPFASLGLLSFVAMLGSASAGCRGNVIAKADLQGAGTAEVHFVSNGGPVVLWADTDGTWRTARSENFPATYQIDIMSNGASVGHVSCSTQDAAEAICGAVINEGMTKSGDCELKMRCDVPALPTGDVDFRVTGTPGGDVTRVKKMSLNIRKK